MQNKAFNNMDEEKKSAEYRQNLFDAAFEGIFVYERGVIMDVNRAAARTFGYTKEELTGRKVLDVIADESREDIRLKIAQAERNPELRLGPYETTALRKDGSTFTAEVFSKRIDFEGRTARVVAFRDITGQILAGRALKDSESLFRNLFESCFEGILLVKNWKIIDANPSAAGILGLDKAGLIGRNPLDFVPEEYHDDLMQQQRKLDENPDMEIGPGEIQCIGAGRKRIDVEIRSRIIPFKDEPLHLVSFHDVSHRKEAERRLRESGQRLRKYNRVLVALASFEILDYAGIGQIAAAITEAAANTLEAHSAGIWILDDKSGKVISPSLYLRETRENIADLTKEFIDYPEYIRAMAESRTLAISNIHEDSRTRELVKTMPPEFNIMSILNATIRKEGRHIGRPMKRILPHRSQTSLLQRSKQVKGNRRKTLLKNS